ncbi:uncharacterized aarF domain-containing protein kinase At1g71810, chloroplastic isoform X3 [Physcomitrium patens]|uniref:Protein kinase domain-containing protein n=1 Tax=Physcomitrium patens TaxID=3218 RepID=A0A7I4F5G1_PHYPA|nr:uncharacterized aarF domain-containing protein kinase At1g71810, chloroplastic-like isoform X3 [Physcomitrium patens]|eukprot:XP_024396488.1 uncharacterized aarF domain-containing protein kinase At1g71810, chloroplastic-like isoform X3 [Physcomitrella patens]
MAGIQAMLGASTLYDLQRDSRVVTHGSKHSLRPSLLINLALRVTLPSSFGRQNCRITCQASSSSGKEDPWQQTVFQPDTFTQYSGYIAEAAIEEADQFNEYNADKIAAVFKRRPFLLARRLLQIAGTLGWWAAVRYGDTLFGKKDQNFKERAGQLRQALVQLGPAFVKIAQAVSSRPDVIPPEYLKELALLQDRIAPFSTELALQIIEQELGVTVEQLFTEISPQPVAAASLGQVYQALLRANGEPVAVKVQRPGVRAAMALDLYILRQLAKFAKTSLKLNTDLPSVVDEWASSLFKEMDYQAEARNGSRFRKMFGNLPDVVVPKMYSELTSRRVLVMEWVEGQRLSEVSDLRLVEVGVFCSLTQLLDSGFYHADPHPGNLLRTPDGKLAYLDFGMMGEMRENLRDGLIEASVHLVNREYELLAGDFVTLGLVPPTAELGEVSKALTGVFQDAVSKGVRNISFGDLSGKLGVTMYKFKFRIPPYFSLVIRSLTVLEGIALSSDPNYKVLGSSYPWIARKVLTDKSPKLRSTLQEIVYKNGSFRINRLESLLTESMRQPLNDPALHINRPAEKEEVEIERNTRNFVKRLLIFGLTEQGDFVRELILDELAKGIDALNRVSFDAAAHNVLTRSPIALPFVAPVTEEEDLKNLENLRQILTVLMKSGNSGSSGVGTVAGMTGGNAVAIEDASINSRSDTQTQVVKNTNSYYLADRTRFVNEDDKNLALSMDDITDIVQSLTGLTQYLPFLSIFPELPFQARQQAVLLPAELAGRVASRVVARNIRGTISSISQSKNDY